MIATQRAHSLPTKSAPPVITRTMPQMISDHPQAVKFEVTSSPDPVTR